MHCCESKIDVPVVVMRYLEHKNADHLHILIPVLVEM